MTNGTYMGNHLIAIRQLEEAWEKIATLESKHDALESVLLAFHSDMMTGEANVLPHWAKIREALGISVGNPNKACADGKPGTPT